MANTKHLDRKERKKVKRRMRREIKKMLASLTPSERKELKKFEGSVKQFLLMKQAEKQKKKEAHEAEAAESQQETPAQEAAQS